MLLERLGAGAPGGAVSGTEEAGRPRYCIVHSEVRKTAMSVWLVRPCSCPACSPGCSLVSSASHDDATPQSSRAAQPPLASQADVPPAAAATAAAMAAGAAPGAAACPVCQAGTHDQCLKVDIVCASATRGRVVDDRAPAGPPEPAAVRTACKFLKLAAELRIPLIKGVSSQQYLTLVRLGHRLLVAAVAAAGGGSGGAITGLAIVLVVLDRLVDLAAGRVDVQDLIWEMEAALPGEKLELMSAGALENWAVHAKPLRQDLLWLRRHAAGVGAGATAAAAVAAGPVAECPLDLPPRTTQAVPSGSPTPVSHLNLVAQVVTGRRGARFQPPGALLAPTAPRRWRLQQEDEKGGDGSGSQEERDGCRRGCWHDHLRASTGRGRTTAR